MKIAIIGAGQVGLALAQGWRRAELEIVLGVRDPSQSRGSSVFDVATPTAAAQWADVVVLALPWAAAPSVIAELGALGDKIVIDCMNPLGMVNGSLGLLVGHDMSGAELVASWANGGRVVKTLNQVGAEIMADTSGFSQPPVMFVAGDDEDAKRSVSDLVEQLGFEPLDAGALRQARLLEPLGMVWINQALMCGKGRDWAFVVHHRDKGDAS
jgi:8-hydroxy-5-deazaflavin:NADPH oxidoreductase